MTKTNEFGPQPLPDVMSRLALTSHELVAASSSQLTFKMVAKGCKGRKLTPNAQNKILTAIKLARPEEEISLKDLFTY